MSDHFVNIWGNSWVRASEVVAVTAGANIDDPPEEWTNERPRPTVYVRMRDGVKYSNVFEDISMNVDAFVLQLVEQLSGVDDEDEG